MIMATNVQPVGNVGSMLERAILAYLQWAYGDEAANYQFLFSNDWVTRQPPYVEVLAHKSSDSPVGSRDETYAVRIEWKWPGNNEAGQENPDITWVEINQFVGVGMAALSQTDNGGADYRATCALINQYGNALATAGSATAQANNADMANFTCLRLRYMGAQRAEAADGAFFIKEVRNFEIDAAATAGLLTD